MSALFDAVLHRPDDLQLRHVLADALQEAGDPRGEFIALQLARDKTGERASPRERDLLAQFRQQWLGRLSMLVQEAKFERGFPHRVQLHRHIEYPAVVERYEEWATIGEVDCRSLDERFEERLLGAPTMRSLREVSGISMPALISITRAKGPLPWRHLAVRAHGYLEALLRSPLPALTSLQTFDSLSPHMLDDVVRSTLGRQLTTLSFRVSAPNELPALLAVALSSSLHTLKGISSGGEFTLDVAARTLRAPKAFLDKHVVTGVSVSVS